MKSGVVGKIDQSVIDMLNLKLTAGEEIVLGESNISHMKNSHPADFEKYGSSISSIITEPDYIALNKKDGSIEYVKEFQIDNEYVKVAVRVSSKGTLFARSIYLLNNDRVKNFIQKGALIPCNDNSLQDDQTAV